MESQSSTSLSDVLQFQDFENYQNQEQQIQNTNLMMRNLAQSQEKVMKSIVGVREIIQESRIYLQNLFDGAMLAFPASKTSASDVLKKGKKKRTSSRKETELKKNRRKKGLKKAYKNKSQSEEK